MQKKIVAVAATVLCASAMPAMAQATGASKVELWGIVDAAVRHTTNEGAEKSGLTKMIGGGMSQSRWGIKVEEDLGGGSKALVELEHRFNTDTGDKDATAPFFQLAYVGLQGPYGRLTMGRQWNVLFDVVTSTYASFPYSPYMDAYKPELGMAMGARTSNMLKYLIATPDRKWVGAVQYSFKEGNDGAATANQASGAAQTAYMNTLMGGGTAAQAAAAASAAATALIGPQTIGTLAGGAVRTVGGYLRYSADGLSLGGGYLRTELPTGTDVDAWTLGGSYRTGPWYFNAGYGLNKAKFASTPANPLSPAAMQLSIDRALLNAYWSGQTNGGFQSGDADKRQLFKVGFGYQITPQLNLGMHYFRGKQTGSVSGNFNSTANFVVAAADYAFSKRTDAYLAIDRTSISGGQGTVLDNTSGARSRTGFTVGLRHRF
ncbi:porin [Comamonas aquatica]|jgi:predicted porin|nr:porin [Comamonas aquatica]